MRLEKEVVLKPVPGGWIGRKEYYEQVMLYIEDYLACVFPIDHLYEDGNPIYQALERGRELRLKMVLMSWDELPQYNNNNLSEENDENDENEG